MPLGLVFFGTSEMVEVVPDQNWDNFHVASFCNAGWQALRHRNGACGKRMTLCLMRGGLQKCVPEKTNEGPCGEGSKKTTKP
jgi:hypothetical protein